MSFKKLALALSVSTLVIAPTIAQAADSVAPARTSSSVTDAEKIEGGSGILIALLAAAAVIAGIILIADGDDDEDLPTSP